MKTESKRVDVECSFLRQSELVAASSAVDVARTHVHAHSTLQSAAECTAQLVMYTRRN